MTLSPYHRRDRALYRLRADGRSRVDVWPDAALWRWLVVGVAGEVRRGAEEGEAEACGEADAAARAGGWGLAPCESEGEEAA